MVEMMKKKKVETRMALRRVLVACLMSTWGKPSCKSNGDASIGLVSCELYGVQLFWSSLLNSPRRRSRTDLKVGSSSGILCWPPYAGKVRVLATYWKFEGIASSLLNSGVAQRFPASEKTHRKDPWKSEQKRHSAGFTGLHTSMPVIKHSARIGARWWLRIGPIDHCSLASHSQPLHLSPMCRGTRPWAPLRLRCWSLTAAGWSR
jgi:hypothetical protein